MSPTKSNSAAWHWRQAALAAAVLLSSASGVLLAAESAKQTTIQSQAATTNAAANDSWRMKYHNNEWWYWHPTNRWSVYRNNRWEPYESQASTQNRRYSPASGAAPLRYESGYRGVPNNPLPQAAAPVYVPRAARGQSSEPSGGMNGQPNDPFIRGN